MLPYRRQQDENALDNRTGKKARRCCAASAALWWLMAFSGLLSAFSLLLVSNTELSLLDNAQVVYMMTGTVLAAGRPPCRHPRQRRLRRGKRARHAGASALCAPVGVDALLAGKALGLLSAWGVMFAVATPYLWAVSAQAARTLAAALFYLALFGTPVVLGFGCLGMALSARTGSVSRLPCLGTVTLLMLVRKSVS